MAKVLRFTLPQERLHPAFAHLNRQLQEDVKSYQLVVANALWGQQGHPFQEEFLRRTRENYLAGLREVDFRSDAEGARETINQWVEERTKNKIKDLLAPGAVNAKTRLVLTNAVYFKSDWANPFVKNSTSELPFQISSREKIVAPLMFHYLTTACYEDKEVQLLEIPYAQNRCSLMVVLPRKVDGLAETERTLSAAWLTERVSRRKVYGVDLIFPKFQLRDGLVVGKQLGDLGIRSAFSPENADFTGICREEKFVLHEVVHKSFVELDEKGTEAAAATGVAVGVPVSAPLPRTLFRADHPFIFLLRENRTGLILFVGRLSNPLIL